MRGLVHYAAPTDNRTACGRWALADNGERLLETDTRAEELSCKACRRIALRAD